MARGLATVDKSVPVTRLHDAKRKSLEEVLQPTPAKTSVTVVSEYDEVGVPSSFHTDMNLTVALRAFLQAEAFLALSSHRIPLLIVKEILLKFCSFRCDFMINNTKDKRHLPLNESPYGYLAIF